MKIKSAITIVFTFLLSSACPHRVLAQAAAESQPSNFQVDLSLASFASGLHGNLTSDFYPAISVSPELRLGFGAKGQWFCAAGWEEFRRMFNAKNPSEVQPSDRSSYKGQELYLAAGHSWELPGATGARGITTGFNRFFIGAGVANLKIAQTPDRFDRGLFFYIGFSADVLAFHL